MEEDTKKGYIPPKYTRFEEERSYDSGDDDDDDYIDDTEDGDTQELENYLDNKDREETEKKKQLNNKFGGNFMQSTPFGQTFGTSSSPSTSSPWATPGTTGSGWGNVGGNSWGQNNSPWGQRTWGQSGSSNNWGQTSGSPWGNTSNNFKKEQIDRTKKIIFCDFLDCIIETFQSNGRPGLLPRGIYDVRLKFEVWDKLKCFNAERIYIITPKFNLTSNNGLDCWTILMNYVTCCLSDYLRVPYQNCQVLTQGVLGQPKKDVISYVINSPDYKIHRSDVLLIGLNSGYAGQSNVDFETAEKLKIDYIDLNQLMSMYF